MMLFRAFEEWLYATLHRRHVRRKRAECDHDWREMDAKIDTAYWNTTPVEECEACGARRFRPILSSSTSTFTGWDYTTNYTLTVNSGE